MAQARKILKRRAGRRRARWRGIRGRPGRAGRGGQRTPLVLAEADSHLGISNRALASRARRVCLAFPLEGRTGDRYRVTGRPVPPKITDRALARAQLGIGPDETCVLVFGGSLGARSINHAAPVAFEDAPYRVVHVAGTRDYPDLDAARAALRPARLPDAVRDRARRRRRRRRALRRLGLRARPVRAAVGADPVPARLGRPPERQRAVDGRAGAARDPPRRRADPGAAARGRPTRCWRAARRCPRPRCRSPSPNAAQDIAHEVLAAVTGEDVHPSE